MRAVESEVLYPTTDNMGSHELERYMTELLRPMLARFLAERGVAAHVGADQFIYWVKGDISTCVAPDIYVLPGVSQSIAISSWKVWESGIAPSLAIEIVSDDAYKDYNIAPRRYADLGVSELSVLDRYATTSRPDTATGLEDGRVRWQVFRRELVATTGEAATANTETTFRRVEQSTDDRVYSAVIGAWLVLVGEGDGRRLRLATGPGGEELVPTAEERAEREAERAAKAEAELAELRRRFASRT